MTEIFISIFIGFVIRLIIMVIIMQAVPIKNISGPPILGVLGFLQYYIYAENYEKMGITPALMFGFFLLEILMFSVKQLRRIK